MSFKDILGLGNQTAAVSGTGLRSVLAQSTDIDILNYALTLEHLEYAFYRDGIKQFTEAKVDDPKPIDYILVEWPNNEPTGEAIPYLVDLVDSGLIRILDLAFIMKNEDGSVTEMEISDLGGESESFTVFEGASSGILDESDHAEAAEALETGKAAALLVYENSWAGPFASAVRRSGGQLVASGRIPVQALIASLDSAEA